MFIIAKRTYLIVVKINKTEFIKRCQFGLANELLKVRSKIVDEADIYDIM